MRRTKRFSVSKAGEREAGAREFFAATHLHHVGNDSYNGQPFYLEPWQRERIWRPVFGCGRMGRDGFVRRHRVALIGLPRDYGKTELACAMLLAEANMSPVPRGQYGIIAYSRDQAVKILGTLRAMIAADPDLRHLWETSKTEIENRETGATIKVFPYSEGALQSWHFNVLIADELHVWRDRTVWNAAVSGMASVPNSLLIAITTASGERSGFLWDWLNGTDDLMSVADDPTAYLWWHGAPDGADRDDPRTWERIALPSWIDTEHIRAARRRMGRDAFDRYILNRWPDERGPDSVFTAREVAACSATAGFDWDAPFSLAVDGAVSGDAFAIVAHQRQDDRDVFHEWVYDDPGESGYYPLAQIEQLIAGIAQEHRVPVGIDPSRLLLMATHLQDEYGVDVYQLKQDNRTMCPACSLVVNSVRDRAACLGGTPKLAEHLRNCLAKDAEPFGMRFTSERHGRGSKRIDAAIAAAMAMLMTQVAPQLPGFAERGGLYSA